MARKLWLLRILAIALLTAVGLAAPAPAHADAIRDRQWHLGHLDVAEAHKVTRGEGVTVAVLDNGVDNRHPDLKDALLKGKTFAGGSSDGWQDATGHGTAMASLIAARGHGPGKSDGVLGMAPGANILPIRVKSDSGRGGSRGLPQGIEWAVDHGADILNISLGGGPDLYLEDALNYALEKGAVVVASAGNTADGDEEVQGPAAHPGVIAVSGTNQEGEFSDASVSGPEVVLAAPAERIMAAGSGTRGRYGVGTGTSDSAAIVSGAAALIKSKYPDLDAANVINRLIATADDRGPEGRDAEYGYGIVNPVKALTADVPEVDANPLLPQSATSPGSTPPTTGDDNAGLSPIGLTMAILAGGAALALAIAVPVLVIRRRHSHGA